MHKIKIPQKTLDTAAERRGGKACAFSHINPNKTALIVIDMQNYFMESGMAAEVPVAREIVPNINKLASKVREMGGQVAWVITSFEDNIFDDWSVMKDLFSPVRCQAMIENLNKDAHGHKLWPGFKRQEQDWVVEKNRFSAFIEGSSDLEARLKTADIDTLIITGTLTDICCESTARDAMMCNFKVIMITDANAAASDDDHNDALNAMARLFADVNSTDEMINRLNDTI